MLLCFRLSTTMNGGFSRNCSKLLFKSKSFVDFDVTRCVHRHVILVIGFLIVGFELFPLELPSGHRPFNKFVIYDLRAGITAAIANVTLVATQDKLILILLKLLRFSEFFDGSINHEYFSDDSISKEVGIIRWKVPFGQFLYW